MRAVPTRWHAVVAGMLTGVVAAGCGGATALGWVIVDDASRRGYALATGKGVVVVAAIGVVAALATPFVSGVARDVASVAGVLAAAVAIGAIVLAAATGVGIHFEFGWRLRSGAWVALGLAIGWAVLAVGLAFGLAERVVGGLTGRSTAAPSARLTAPFVGVALATVVLIIGVVGPWQKIGVFSASGLEGGNGGWVVLVGALLAIPALVSYLLSGRRVTLLVPLLAGLESIGAAAQDRSRIDNAGNSTVGWGLNATLAASLALALMAAILLFLRERRSARVAELRAADTSEETISEAEEKVCPDCAESVKSQARICRFCGYAFDA